MGGRLAWLAAAWRDLRVPACRHAMSFVWQAYMKKRCRELGEREGLHTLANFLSGDSASLRFEMLSK
eukprot:2589264-Amphidinium_carterae.1